MPNPNDPAGTQPALTPEQRALREEKLAAHAAELRKLFDEKPVPKENRVVEIDGRFYRSDGTEVPPQAPSESADEKLREELRALQTRGTILTQPPDADRPTVEIALLCSKLAAIAESGAALLPAERETIRWSAKALREATGRVVAQAATKAELREEIERLRERLGETPVDLDDPDEAERPAVDLATRLDRIADRCETEAYFPDRDDRETVRGAARVLRSAASRVAAEIRELARRPLGDDEVPPDADPRTGIPYGDPT